MTAEQRYTAVLLTLWLAAAGTTVALFMATDARVSLFISSWVGGVISWPLLRDLVGRRA